MSVVGEGLQAGDGLASGVEGSLESVVEGVLVTGVTGVVAFMLGSLMNC